MSLTLFRIIMGISWVTGVLYFSLDEYALLKIHGVSAFLMMILYGFYIGTHVLPRWKRKSKSGRALLITIGSLIVTGYILYYSGSEVLREVVEYIHASIGFVLPVILYSHIKKMKGKRA